MKTTLFLGLISFASAQIAVVPSGPLPPTNVLLQLISDDSFVLSWTPSAGDLDYYMLDYFPQGGSVPRVRVAVNKTERFHVEVNKDINKHKIGVQLFSVLGQTPSQGAAVQQLQDHDKRLPPKIMSATKQWVSQTAVELQWTLPQNGIYNELHLIYAPHDKKQDERSASVKLPRTATSYKIQDLIRSKQYTIHLYTVNNGLHSDPTDLQNLPDAPTGCGANPCKHGGTCVTNAKDPHLFTCQCKAGFDGVRCENNINDCSPNPCKNNALCIDGDNTYTCVCDSGFTGKLCDALSGGSGLRASIPFSMVFFTIYKILF